MTPSAVKLELGLPLIASAMLNFLPAPLLGLVVTVLFIANTLFWATPVYVLIPLKLVPIPALRRLTTKLMHALCTCWLHGNVLIAQTSHGTRWTVTGAENLRKDAQYLVISNHQTWNDIYVAMKVLGGKAPFFKFFIKQELIWVPVLGLIWWALDYPFMKRYSAAKLRARPELAGEDMRTAQRSCAKYKDLPVTILNYAEGTRFTPAKQAQQNSPYKYLLRPKTGGLAFAAAAMGPSVNTLLDMTIVYADGAGGFWDFMCGRNKHIIVDVKTRTVPANWYTSNYKEDADFRRESQAWLAQIWQEKDELIARELQRLHD